MQHTPKRRLIDILTSDAAVGAWIAASLIAASSVVGIYATSPQQLFKATGASDNRPRPIWMSLKPVHAQMADGEMLSVKVSLQLSKTRSADELTAYSGVFGSLVEQAGQRTSRHELKSTDGIERFDIQIQRQLNDYLDDRDATPSRVTSVMFDELTPLPR